MRTLEVIDAEIAELKQELETVRGTETEVYTRIVGYYRSLRNWNKGKKEEYSFRLPFRTSDEEGREEKEAPRKENVASYSYFFRKTCPNCPPVAEFVGRLSIEGKRIDVDTEEGMNEAVNHQVLSTPTVVFFDREGRPLHQVNTVNQMEGLFAVLPRE